MKEWFKKNSILICIEALFILSCVILPKEYILYTNFIFYLAILIYFIIKKEFSFKELKESLCSGKKFWIPVALTVLFLIIAFAFTGFLEGIFKNLDAGMIGLERNTLPKLIIFAISTIILPPLAEELFFRKSMISFKNKKALIITTILSMFLYALEHTFTPFGIVITMIWAIPFSISYIKTKNVYVPMVAHFITNLIGNGATVVMTLIALMK